MKEWISLTVMSKTGTNPADSTEITLYWNRSLQKLLILFKDFFI